MEITNGSWAGMGMGMGWGWLFGLLLVAGSVTLIILVVRLSTDGRPSAHRDPETETGQHRARAILDERYARGEIDTTEYEERLRVLRGDR